MRRPARADPMSAASSYRFGPYRFDARGRVLMRGDLDLGLPPKAADTLLLFLKNAGEVVEKATLLDSVWGDVVVGEGSLTRNP
jgi:DNA-binding winged helix-turn-helix (wHTH) protein